MITELQQVAPKYRDETGAYVFRLNAEHSRQIFWCDYSGERPTWVIQIIDNDGNQIGNARFAANKRCLADKLEHSYTTPENY